MVLADVVVLAVVPARYGSTRFPGKPLAPIAGRPMIQHVVERVRQAKLVSRTIVATDDARIKSAVEAGYPRKRFAGSTMFSLKTEA